MKAFWTLVFTSLSFGADWHRAAVGLTESGKIIEAWRDPQPTKLPRVLMIAGLSGTPDSNVIKQILFYQTSPAAQQKFHLTAIPFANPTRATLQFPPAGDSAYREHQESYAIWRFIGFTAPDLVLVVGDDPSNLTAALESNSPASVGRVHVKHIDAKPGFLESLQPPAKSEGRIEIEKRLARSPLEFATQMSKVYGHELNEAVYIPAMALIGRIRLGQQAEVEKIVAPYINGTKKSLDKASSSHFSGHLVFAELAERTHDAHYTALVKAAADFAFDANGAMKESMPLHNQMSDSVFMGCPILVKAGKLTSDAKYYEMALRHFRFMKKLDLRADKLWRHSPLDETAWGRGNAFALLGMALTLEDLPKTHPGFKEILDEYQSLAAALIKQQDNTGMWRQVIDLDGSYRELSATAMIGRAILIGTKNKWLHQPEYNTAVQKAWEAVKTRSGSDGTLIDVCESTGAQKSLADYLKRKAILGIDPRGGAMVMMFAVEQVK